MRIAGMISGTSVDAIDVAVTDIGEAGWKLVEFGSNPYPANVREEILAISNANTHTSEISRLNWRIGELFAEAVNKLASRDSIELIGSHGQTIFHCPTHTLQIGEGSVIAERTGKPVVSDFRTRDVAAGGFGAPLVPFADYIFYRHPERNRVSLNIGGIGNITTIPAGARSEQVTAFDTGPGNMVLDQIVSHFSKGAKTYDDGGELSAQGVPNDAVIAGLMADAYYAAPPPKTAGREQYGAHFVQRIVGRGLSAADCAATAAKFTAKTIAAGIERFGPKPVHDLIVSGGGVRNPVIMWFLSAELPGVNVSPSDAYGVPAAAKEAIAFALMAYETWHRRPSNVPSATGARKPVILGKISL